MQSASKKVLQRVGVAIASLCAAIAIWLPTVHLLFMAKQESPAVNRISVFAHELAETQLRAWRDPVLKEKALDAMRRTNNEWDFMGRTFLALSLCEMSLRDPSLKAEYLRIVDAIIDETIALEKENGMHFFLMPYSRARPYRVQPERSLFIDSEIALMVGTRRVVEEKQRYKELFLSRTKQIEDRLSHSSAMAVESYPDECWIFDHAIALAAMRIGDALDGTDHSQLFSKWVTLARERLVHSKSGILVSSYTTEAQWLDGPEGSSIWAAAHFLKFFDRAFAESQNNNARREIARSVCGFGWSREWPRSWQNHLDVDSGAVIPLVDASAGASGMALIAAASFKDEGYLNALRTSLNFAAFPVRNHGALRYSASNAVGDAALLYAETLGAVYEKVTFSHLVEKEGVRQ